MSFHKAVLVVVSGENSFVGYCYGLVRSSSGLADVNLTHSC
jgi:hypothetical protein